jgi:hypothetical protein
MNEKSVLVGAGGVAKFRSCTWKIQRASTVGTQQDKHGGLKLQLERLTMPYK